MLVKWHRLMSAGFTHLKLASHVRSVRGQTGGAGGLVEHSQAPLCGSLALVVGENAPTPSLVSPERINAALTSGCRRSGANGEKVRHLGGCLMSTCVCRVCQTAGWGAGERSEPSHAPPTHTRSPSRLNVRFQTSSRVTSGKLA